MKWAAIDWWGILFKDTFAPGRVTITRGRGRRVDPRLIPDSSVVAREAELPVEFTITLGFPMPHYLANWQTLKPSLVGVVRVRHPTLHKLGITQALVLEIKDTAHVAKIDCIEVVTPTDPCVCIAGRSRWCTAH